MTAASGKTQHTAELCITCKGAGDIEYEEMCSPGPNGSYSTETVSATCPVCNGSGIVNRAAATGEAP